MLWQEFIDKCEILMANAELRDQLRLNAQQFMQEHHSPENEKQQYINVISELTGVFPSVLWHCWLGDRKGIRPVKKTGYLFVGGDDLSGALHNL